VYDGRRASVTISQNVLILNASHVLIFIGSEHSYSDNQNDKEPHRVNSSRNPIPEAKSFTKSAKVGRICFRRCALTYGCEQVPKKDNVCNRSKCASKQDGSACLFFTYTCKETKGGTGDTSERQEKSTNC
jgi:hypothetical protein